MKNNSKFSIFLILTSKHRGKLCILFIMMMLSAFFDVFSIGLLLPLLDLLVGGNQSSYIFTKLEYIKFFFNINTATYLNSLIFLICLFFVIKNFFSLVYRKFSFNFFVFLNLYFQEKILEKQLSRNFNFFLNKNSSEFINIFWNEVKFIGSGFIQPTITIIFNFIQIIFFLFFLFYLNFKITLIVFFVLFFFVLFFIKIFKKKIIFYGIERKKRNLLVIKLLKQTFEGIKELKFFNKERCFDTGS